MWGAIIGYQQNILKWSQYHMPKGLLDSFSSWFKWHLMMYFSFGLHLWTLCLCMISFLPCKFQLHCLEKNGRQITKMVSYCAYHRYKILTSVISLSSFPVFSMTCVVIPTISAMGSMCGFGLPWYHPLQAIIFVLFTAFAFVFMVSSSLQGTKSRYSFDCTNSSWGIFCQKPSPK